MSRPEGAALVARLGEVCDVAHEVTVRAVGSALFTGRLAQYQRCILALASVEGLPTADSAASRERNSPATNTR